MSETLIGRLLNFAQAVGVREPLAIATTAVASAAVAPAAGAGAAPAAATFAAAGTARGADEPQILAALRTSLRRAPFHVLTATSGGAALALLAQHRITVLVADHDIPGRSGVELLAAVARAQPGIAGIMLAGQARLEVAIGAINSGEVFRFFTKPVEREVLTAGILAAIGQSRATAAGKLRLQEEQRHGRAIAELEQANPGITQVETTRTGAIVVAAPTEDLATLLAAAAGAGAMRHPRDGGPK